MELNTLQHCRFQYGNLEFLVEYFLTADLIEEDLVAPGLVALVVSWGKEENQKHCVTKSVALLRQPKDIIEIIVQREVLHLVQSTNAALA
ncbi:MAG: hypothetical protein ACXVMS_05865 [Flavisolibacter sp.]